MNNKRELTKNEKNVLFAFYLNLQRTDDFSILYNRIIDKVPKHLFIGENSDLTEHILRSILSEIIEVDKYDVKEQLKLVNSIDDMILPVISKVYKEDLDNLFGFYDNDNYLGIHDNHNAFLSETYTNLINKYLSQFGDFQITSIEESLINEDDVHFYVDITTDLPYELFKSSG